MNHLDIFHLFAIPEWLPAEIPAELWAIIFHWKWRLEMKDILTELKSVKPQLLEPQLIELCPIKEFCPFSRTWGQRGNMWSYTLIDKQFKIKRVITNPRCGIELINVQPDQGVVVRVNRYKLLADGSDPICSWIPSMFDSNDVLYTHIKDNLGFEFNIPYPQTDDDLNTLIKLLRTV